MVDLDLESNNYDIHNFHIHNHPIHNPPIHNQLNTNNNFLTSAYKATKCEKYLFLVLIVCCIVIEFIIYIAPGSFFPLGLRAWLIFSLIHNFLKLGLWLHTIYKDKYLSLRINQNKWRFVKVMLYLIVWAMGVILVIWSFKIKSELYLITEFDFRKHYYLVIYVFFVSIYIIYYVLVTFVYITFIIFKIICECNLRITHHNNQVGLRNASITKKFSEWMGIEITCMICLEPYDDNDIVRRLNCGHDFHQSCVDSWLLLHDDCPQCRQKINKRLKDLRSPSNQI